MCMQRGKIPYRQFGQRLSEIRKALQESVSEVSGAVEIETETFKRYERGEERPSEDILSLLIDHFAIKEDEADELWELAGYSQDQPKSDDLPNVTAFMVLPVDSRIVYTDTAHVSINNFGVVMNFMQNGPQNQPMAVARVGMSLDHAKSVLDVLAKTISQAEAANRPKLLPNRTNNPNRAKKPKSDS